MILADVEADIVDIVNMLILTADIDIIDTKNHWSILILGI